ncbi:MAG: cation diffusion facilitator family transporter, partial [Bacillota bacterium]|nr:cation diffusion facilitator family transporter [Bacillota bacterium]
MKESIKEPDEEHNFGHAKIESVSTFVEALFILLAGVLIIIEAVKKITSQHPIESINIGIIVMLISSAVNFFISRLLLSIVRKQNSIALEADAYHLLTDVYTSAGVMAGLLLIKYTGITTFDIISAVIVAAIIIKTSIKFI